MLALSLARDCLQGCWSWYCMHLCLCDNNKVSLLTDCENVLQCDSRWCWLWPVIGNSTYQGRLAGWKHHGVELFSHSLSFSTLNHIPPTLPKPVSCPLPSLAWELLQFVLVWLLQWLLWVVNVPESKTQQLTCWNERARLAISPLHACWTPALLATWLLLLMLLPPRNSHCSRLLRSIAG